jgi:phage virion morphogenesis protein
MVDITVQVDDRVLSTRLRELIALGTNMAPIMADIAALGENATRLRFRTETGPDGTRWKPSLRARITGGRTLTKDGHLADSISSGSSNTTAEWGVNRIYAAIHQFGGTIRPKKAKYLRFRLAGGGYASVKQVVMPPRPFLGVSDDDREDILDIIAARIQGDTHAH